MIDNSNLKDEINKLINLRKEGPYWDFKVAHHTQNADLLHDILCLANADHDGPRYIIYGVSDDFKIVGIKDTTPHKTQADIIGLLSDNQTKFAFNRYPDVRLDTVVLEEKEIEVLIIENRYLKPYYLTEKYCDVRSYAIYTRTEDRNTPKDKSATPDQVETMWRERFGLNLSAIEKAHKYLDYYNDWEQDTFNGNAMWFHKTFPEFTIRVEGAEDFISCHDEWTRGEIITDNNSVSYYDIYFHQTRLARIRWVSFDDNKKSIVSPKWEALCHGRLYFYEKNSLEFSMHKFHVVSEGGEDHAKKIRIRASREQLDGINPANLKFVPIPTVSQNEIDEFIHEHQCINGIEPSSDIEEQYRIFISNQFSLYRWLNSRAPSPQNTLPQ